MRLSSSADWPPRRCVTAALARQRTETVGGSEHIISSVTSLEADGAPETRGVVRGCVYKAGFVACCAPEAQQSNPLVSSVTFVAHVDYRGSEAAL